MKKVEIARLTKLAEHLESGRLGHEVFDFSVVNADKNGESVSGALCGYAGCAIGELPVIFPRLVKWDQFGWPYTRGKGEMRGAILGGAAAAEQLFGITSEECSHLFIRGYQRPEKFGGARLGGDATRYDVAVNIRAFLKTKGQA